MIIDLLVYLGIAIAWFVAGVVVERRVLHPKKASHDHIWGPWEDCAINGYEWIGGSKVKTVEPGQSRDCMSCGEREARKVMAV